MPGFGFAGHEFRIVGERALFWPAQSALLVADLHLEKASWFAARGQLLPPYDSLATLKRVDALIGETGARSVICLGDNFHDNDGPNRMQEEAVGLLRKLTERSRWFWITGNHDAQLPATVGGKVETEMLMDGLILRHRAVPADGRPELSGHYHPKVRVRARQRTLSRPCFVRTASRLIFPAFGALTGGLFVDHPEIVAITGGTGEALLVGHRQLVSFALPSARAAGRGGRP